MNNEERWQTNYDALKAYIAEHGHLPDKHKVEFRGLLNWTKYQRKRIKENTMPTDQQTLFEQLMNSRSTEHTGGNKKKITPPCT